jgi:hypothetical protein
MIVHILERGVEALSSAGSVQIQSSKLEKPQCQVGGVLSAPGLPTGPFEIMTTSHSTALICVDSMLHNTRRARSG